jgi:hypothetical protein
MKLEKAIAINKEDVISSILIILKEDFQFIVNENQVERLGEFINRQVDGLYYFLEYPYVDKVYRDSYYNYFSMKNYPYRRDCLKVGIFSKSIDFQDFSSAARKDYLQSSFLGFFIIRPTSQILGRTVLSPKVFKHSNFLICETPFKVTIGHLEFEIRGFPHASQDIETMTCGETSIWALVEYYGNKKPHYRTALPSTINSIINKISHVRRLPSDGVGLSQISSAVKKLGFSSKLYAKDSFKHEFYELLSCYVESGIPIIAIVENHSNGEDHAILCIGHEEVSLETYEKYWLPKSFEGLTILDNDLVLKNFIFIDDNRSPYQRSLLTLDSKSEKLIQKKGLEKVFVKYNISHFIAPLYQKIFLDAHYAKAFVKSFIMEGPINMRLKKKSEHVIRLYLATGRSYKKALIEENLISNLYVKESILEIPFPNFIWIAEISNKKLYVIDKKANGIIIIDATEADNSADRGILIACINDYILQGSEKEKELNEPFETKIFRHNLRMV